MSAFALGARLFASELDAALLAGLRAGPFAAHLALDAANPPPLHTELEDLAVEYCRLFVMPDAPCPPNVAAMRHEPMLGGRASRELLVQLEVHGYESVAAIHGDHVASYLELAAELPPEARSAFLRPHRAWLRTYFLDVEEATTVGLYRGAARLVVALLEDDADAPG
ncbi:MAG: hypothetical protein EXQ77_06035 [Thermoleophilia bacterium]|nr:hypothetical protein [Thermoleophilia bacterium]